MHTSSPGHARERTGRVAEYLDRIGDDGPLDATADTLGRLQRAHLLAVPFENLDIHRGRPIVLDLEAVFEKVVRRRRGGFCYELNGLFGWLLGELGFDVSMVSARVADERGELGPEFDHMALLVRLDRVWLADVGFGAFSREPLPLVESEERLSDGVAYSVERDADAWTVVARDANGARPEYRFAPVARRLDEFEPMCHFHQTSPESHFTRKRVCSLATPDGRVTVSDLRLIVTRGAERTERDLADEAEVAATLGEMFGVDLLAD
jgi:N-hydroxyarylamine O-acetyltransferase